MTEKKIDREGRDLTQQELEAVAAGQGGSTAPVAQGRERAESRETGFLGASDWLWQWG